MAYYKPCSNEWLISWENKRNNNILPVHQIILQHLSQCDQHLNKSPSDWTQPAGGDWRWRLVPSKYHFNMSTTVLQPVSRDTANTPTKRTITETLIIHPIVKAQVIGTTETSCLLQKLSASQ